MKKYFALNIAILLIYLSPSELHAWGQYGHRIIGEMASNMLSPKTKEKVEAVLNDYSVAMVANWADFVKSDNAYDKYNTWHYVNLDDGLSRQEFDKQILSTDNGECVYRIIWLIGKLRQNPNDNESLKFLIHLIGDICQPLHLGRSADKGGNTIKIRWFGQNTNLHTLWDSKLIERQQLSYTEYATYLTKIHKPTAKKYSKELLLQTAWDTYSVVSKIYDSAESTGNGYRYIYDYIDICEQQLVSSAILLASVLEYIY